MLAYKQESHYNKIQTISHHSSPKSSNKSTKPFFQLIQAKSEKSPLCGGADLVHYVSFLHYLVIERALDLEDKID